MLAMRALWVFAVVLGPLLLAERGAAQALPDPEAGRYTFSKVVDGVLRLDTRNGQVSHCAQRATGWVCSAVPDERAALDSEIGRLQRENAALKRDLLARGAPLPGGRGESPPDLRLPSDADVDRVMSFVEKVWRRLMDMVQGMQRDYQKRT